MKFFAFLVSCLFSWTVLAQTVEIGSDPQDIQEAKTETKVQGEYPLILELNKEERQKVLAVLKKIHPQRSFKELNLILAKHMSDGKVELTPEQAKELFILMKDEPDQTLLNKIENMALGTKNGLFAGIDQIRDAFANNPLSLVPQDQVKETLLKQWEGQKIGEILKDHPKILDFLTRMVVDKQAIPRLLDIFKKQSELKYYAILVILMQVMCILAFFVLFKHDRFFMRFFKRTMLYVGLNFLLLSYFIWRFYPEVSPSLNILKSVVMS